MSTTLFFLVPIGMLAVTWGFCFVGCKLPTTGIDYGKPYSNQILDEATLVAYWPLNDAPGSVPPPPAPQPPQNSKGVGTAVDHSGNHNGAYINPPAYPPAANVPGSTPFANPTLKFAQTSIVPGDALQSGSAIIPQCVEFLGGYVSIPWSMPALSSFTFEAWVKPNWTAAGNNYVVFSALSGGTGFSVFVNGDNVWQVNIGNGEVVLPNPFVPVDLSGVSYVAVTYDSTMQVLSFWVNPDGDGGAPMPAAPPVPNTVYAPVTQPVAFFIGAGLNDDPPRTQPQANGNTSPLYPFQGWIQSVALYSSALDSTDLGDHFAAGSGAESG